MNIIEQLGGYIRSKNYLENGLITGFRAFQLQDELLQYRKDHNIFENGDYCTLKDGNGDIHKVEIGAGKAHCIKIFSTDMSHSYWVHDANYKHA